MKRYIEDMDYQELKELVAVNGGFKHQLYELAMETAQMWVEEYTYGLRNGGGADYRIGAADRGSYFRIEEDYAGRSWVTTFDNFRKWFIEVQDAYCLLNDEDTAVVEKFLHYANVLEKLFDVPCKDRDMVRVNELRLEWQTNANTVIYNRLMAEFDIDDAQLIEETDRWVMNNEGAYADECGGIYIDIPAHSQRIA